MKKNIERCKKQIIWLSEIIDILDNGFVAKLTERDINWQISKKPKIVC